MKTPNLSIIALAAAMLTGCSFGGAKEERVVTADPTTVTTSTTSPTTATVRLCNFLSVNSVTLDRIFIFEDDITLVSGLPVLRDFHQHG